MCLLLRLAQGLTLTSSSIRFCLDTLNCGKLQTYAVLSMLLILLALARGRMAVNNQSPLHSNKYIYIQ